jgi:hypothetical protein
MFLRIFIALTLISLTFSQMMNTAETLKKGDGVARFSTSIYDNDTQFNIHGGYGLKSGMDLEARVSFGGAETYFGIDLEYLLSNKGGNAFSVFGGFHNYGDFGLDFGAAFSTGLGSKLDFYAAFDGNLDFYDVPDGSGGTKSESKFDSYIVLGFDIPLKRTISVGFEGSIGISDNTQNIITLGVNYYL